MLLFQLLASAESKFSYEDTAIKLGLNIVSIGKPFTFPGVHRFYTDQGFKRAMMVMENVEGKREKLVTTEYDKYTMVEYPVSETTYNSVAFVNISKAQIETYLIPSESTVYNKLDRFMGLFISKAHAAESCKVTSIDASMGESLSDLKSYFGSEYFQIASSCLMGVLEGIWDSTGGMVVSAWSGLKKLASDPKGFWGEKVGQFNKIKSFLADFQVNMQKMFTSFMNLPDTAKAQMLCSFVSSIGTDVLIGVLVGGANFAKVAESVKSFVTKLMKVETLVARLNRLGRLAELPASFFTKLSKGLISEKRLSAIEIFAKNDYDNLAMQLVRCSL